MEYTYLNRIQIKWKFLIFLIIYSTLAIAQNNSSTSPQIISFDRSILSGVDLKKVDMKDTPERLFYQRNLFRGDNLSVYVVGTQTWESEMTNFPFDEFVCMYQGEAVVKPANGPTQVFHAGDYFFAPKGFTGYWNINSGNNLHYEFSVITTRRADSTEVIKDQRHQLLDPSILSGAHIDLGNEGLYEETLVKGAELTIKLKAEKPTTKEFEADHDLLVHILSGMVSVGEGKEERKQFYSGDYFLLPKGAIVEWSTKGHGLVKYLTIEESS